MPKAVWFCNIYDFENDEIVQIAEMGPKDSMREAVEKGKEILAAWAMPCDVGCCGAGVDEPGDCDNCPLKKEWDEFEKEVEEEMKNDDLH